MVEFRVGELHLEVVRNRMQREFNVRARFGRPRVSYRETVLRTGRAVGDFDRRIGDAQVTGRAEVEVAVRPRPPGIRGAPPVELELAGTVLGLSQDLQRITREAVLSACSGGGPRGYPMMDVRARVLSVALSDAPDPSVPLLAAVTLAMRRAFAAAGTALLGEPVMRLDVRAPEESVGSRLGRRTEAGDGDRTRRRRAIHGARRHAAGVPPPRALAGRECWR